MLVDNQIYNCDGAVAALKENQGSRYLVTLPIRVHMVLFSASQLHRKLVGVMLELMKHVFVLNRHLFNLADTDIDI